jgi:hypothetical protein
VDWTYLPLIALAIALLTIALTTRKTNREEN